MKITYAKRKYRVTFFEGVYIKLLQLFLFLKRSIRRCSVLFGKVDLLLYFVITLCWVLFAFVSFKLRIHPSTFNDVAYSFADALWDIRSSWFSSVILAMVIRIVSNAKEYKKQILNQYELYIKTMYESQEIVSRYIGRDGIALYTQKCFEDATVYLERFFADERIDTSEWLFPVLTQITKRLDKIENELRSNNLVWYNKRNLKYYLNASQDKINELQTYSNVKINKLIHLCRDLLGVIDELRAPWRRDEKIKIAILQILDRHSENRISKSYYFKMFLHGLELEEPKGQA